MIEGSNFLFHHPSGRRVDGRFADRQAQAGKGDTAYAFALQEPDARTGGEADSGKNQPSVSNVGVIACVLPDSGSSGIVRPCHFVEGEGNVFAVGQGDGDFLADRLPQQSQQGRLGGRRGTGSCGEAAA